MLDFHKKRLLSIALLVITLSMMVSIVFTYYNSQIIEKNKKYQDQGERVKYNCTSIFADVVRGLDVGIRGYALTHDEAFYDPFIKSYTMQDSLFNNIIVDLKDQNYDLKDVYQLQDSVKAFTELCKNLFFLAKKNDTTAFQRLFRQDRGHSTYLVYISVTNKIRNYEEKIIKEAQKEYELALILNYVVNIFVFLICVPTLLFTIRQTKKAFLLNEKLISIEKENADIVAEQNHTLERVVRQRTEEIAAQNEELIQQQEQIMEQRDMLFRQNEELMNAQGFIKNQNQYLESEVQARTSELILANKELLVHNNQLEQFSFVIAHNLRAPVARLLGLGSVLELPDQNPKERDFIVRQIVVSTQQLDNVIKDLNLILETRKNNVIIHAKVDLNIALEKAINILEEEIKETDAVIKADFSEVDSVNSFSPYIDSILLNLINNAIKYKSPERNPVIEIKSWKKDEEYICISFKDNGLGIDLKIYHSKIFSLYKRFHTHVEGKGLGLYLVKTQINNMGGFIEVYSEVDVGTTFLIYLKNNQ